MPWYEVLKWIAIMAVILGVLISLHEAGHLVMAKIFNVYCFDYSIGFGPAFLHVKRKKGETYFSIRAIPLGGFVSMYGETGAVPEGFEEPPAERSLNNIHKAKKCAILSAGIVVNFILGLVLIAISSFACSHYYWAYSGYNGETYSIEYVCPEYSGQALAYLESVKPADNGVQDFYLPIVSIGDNVAVLDDEVYIVNVNGDRVEDSPRIAVYYPSDVTKEASLTEFLRLYPAAKDEQGNYVAPSEELQQLGFHYMPDTSGYLDYSSSSFNNTSFSLNLNFILPPKGSERSIVYDLYKAGTYLSASDEIKFSIKDGKCSDAGFKMPIIKERFLGWEKGWQDWGNKTLNSITAIGLGFKTLFTEGLQNMSSVVGMTAALPQVAASGGAANIFFFAGLISINLAFFNLLPFPGLDGWQLLTTIVEGISRKRIPPKVQGIVSIIGIVALLAIGVFVIIKDIVLLF